MRRRFAFIALATVLALTGLGLWLQHRSSDAEDDRADSSATKQVIAAFTSIVSGGLAEGEISSSRQWQPFSEMEPVAGGVPLQTRLAVAETLGGRAALDTLGLEFGSARRARTPSGLVLWMVSGRGVMCLIREKRVAISCASKRRAIRRGLLLQIHRNSRGASEPNFMAIGVAPDWAAGISLEAGGVPVTLPIQANAFDFSATRSIRVLKLTR